MYSDDLASCQTKAQGGVFKEPVEMDLWNADDYVVSKSMCYHIISSQSSLGVEHNYNSYNLSQNTNEHIK